MKHELGSEMAKKWSARREGDRCSCEGEECVSVEGWQVQCHYAPVRYALPYEEWRAMGLYGLKFKGCIVWCKEDVEMGVGDW